MLRKTSWCGLVFLLVACGAGADRTPELDTASLDDALGLAACGWGLYCSGAPMPGATACTQPGSGATIYCCPSGETIIDGHCSGSPPACGWGLYCAGSQIPGAAACVQPGSGATIYCCPSGETIIDGHCSGSPPACGWGLYCSSSQIPGASACMSGSNLVYCCPAGEQIINGACAGADPFCVDNCGCDNQGNNCDFGPQGEDVWCRCCLRDCGGQRTACDAQGYATTCTPHFEFCQQSCGCDEWGEACNFGPSNTDNWCQCCAEDCGGNEAICVDNGYAGDQGFPAGTSRQCGCLNRINSHDFTLADNNNLGSCYGNLRSNPEVTGGLQTIWHPGSSQCSSGRHMHIDPSHVATEPHTYGIDCLGQPTYNGQTCTQQTFEDGRTCTFLWQGAAP